MSEPTQNAASRPSFYTYVDAHGQQHIVDSLELIPEKYREMAQKISLEERAQKVVDKARTFKKDRLRQAKKVQREIGDVVPFVKELDLPSVGVGFAMCLVGLLVISVVRRTSTMLLKLALVGVIVVVLGGAYLGWVRRAAGLSDASLSNPKEIIEDARKAAGDVQRRVEKQERQLREIEESAR